MVTERLTRARIIADSQELQPKLSNNGRQRLGPELAFVSIIADPQIREKVEADSSPIPSMK